MKVVIMIYSLVLVGCGSLSTDLAGTYKQTHNWEFNTQLNLDSDMHYTYNQRVGNIWLISEGRWRVNHDTLFLRDTLDNNILGSKSQSYLIKRNKLVERRDSLAKSLTLMKQRSTK